MGQGQGDVPVSRDGSSNRYTGAAALVARTGLGILVVGVAGFAVFAYGFRPLGAMVHPDLRPSFAAHPAGLYVHVFASVVALLLGPLQFSTRLRRRSLELHRRLGSVALLATIIGGLAGLHMARFAYGGLASRLGFAALALLWLATAVMGIVTIARGDVAGHRRWLVRNFALTLAAVSLRLYIPLSFVAGIDFARAYPVIAWLCWVPNLAVAEIWFARPRRGTAAVSS